MNHAARTIAVVLHNFPLGGTERIAVRLMNRWAEMGRKVVVLCGELRGPLVDMLSEKVQVVECSPPIPRSIGSRLRLARALPGFITKFRPDVLFVPGNFEWMVLPAMAAVPKEIRPGVVTQISTPLFRHGRGPVVQVFYNLMIRYLLRCVDTAIALSPFTVAAGNQVIGRQITQCIRLPALNDTDGAEPLTPANGNLILAAGRLVKGKGFDVALRAFARVEDLNARLVILGEGPKQAQLLSLAEELGVKDRVEFLGYVPNIFPWLQRARVFLLSSFYEGYGAVILEALAAGRPVVCTNCTPAVSDLLSGMEGCVVTPIGDPVALAGALNQVLCASPPDPAALARAVAGYRIGLIADEYLDVFDGAYSRMLRSDFARSHTFAEISRLSPKM